MPPKMKTIPYARGFYPPSPEKQLEAIGCAKSPSVYLDPTETFFEPVPKPMSEDDWLVQYNENGQTFEEFVAECPWLSSRKIKHTKTTFRSSGSNILKKYPNGKICLVQMGEFDLNHAPRMVNLVEYARAFFQLPVHVLPTLILHIGNGVVHLVEKKVPTTTTSGIRKSFRTIRTRLNARFDPTSGKLQLNVDTALMYLRKIIPADALCLVALTMHDLYADKSDLFVAGMAAGNHRVGVFSFHRYDPTLTFSQEFWYESERVKMNERIRSELILQRSCKLLVHEVSHILGIDHCIYFSCCMNGSGHLEEDYRQSMHLCPVDLHKLHYLCGFDVIKRYDDLLQFFTKHGMTEEKNWITKRMDFIRAKTS